MEGVFEISIFPVMLGPHMKYIITEWKVHVVYNKRGVVHQKTKLLYFEYLKSSFLQEKGHNSIKILNIFKLFIFSEYFEHFFKANL